MLFTLTETIFPGTYSKSFANFRHFYGKNKTAFKAVIEIEESPY